MKLDIDKEKTKEMTEKIQKFIEDEFDESIGELRAGIVLDFFIKELGPPIYNQAIQDAQVFIQDKLIDLESTLYFEE